MRIGSRKSLIYSGISFDSSAIAYFNAAGITNQTEKVAANTLIVGLKSGGLWDKLDSLHLFSPTSEVASLICAKGLGSMTNVNSVSWDTNGFQPDYSSNYINVGYDFSTDAVNASINDYSFGLAFTGMQQDVSGAVYFSGIYDTVNSVSCFFASQQTGPTYVYNGPTPSTTTNYGSSDGVNLSKHLYGTNKTTSRTIYVDGTPHTNSTTSVTAGTEPSINFFIGAIAVNGSPFYAYGSVPVIDPHFNFHFISSWLTDSEIAMMFSLSNAYNTALGRGI